MVLNNERAISVLSKQTDPPKFWQFKLSQFLFPGNQHGAKSAKYAPCENFPLYGNESIVYFDCVIVCI